MPAPTGVAVFGGCAAVVRDEIAAANPHAGRVVEIFRRYNAVMDRGGAALPGVTRGFGAPPPGLRRRRVRS